MQGGDFLRLSNVINSQILLALILITPIPELLAM